MSDQDLISTDEASVILDCSSRRVRQLFDCGSVTGIRSARDILIYRESAQRHGPCDGPLSRKTLREKAGKSS
jgi:hypothetical protein